MSLGRPLRGGCQCGRNSYVVTIPESGSQLAGVVFGTERIHQSHLGPLSSFLRVPLSWLASSTHAFFPDESHATIRRTYTHPSRGHSKRHFCGFCGTPISYWTEEPRSEADFINLTLGSLERDDLLLLDALGLVDDGGGDDGGRDPEHTTGPPLASVPQREMGRKRNKKKQRVGVAGGEKGHGRDGEGNQARQGGSKGEEGPVLQAGKDWSLEPLPEPIPQTQTTVVAPPSRAPGPDQLVESYEVPWFDALISGSRLHRTGNLKRTTGSSQSNDGRVRSQWEIVEWTPSDEDEDEDDENDDNDNDGDDDDEDGDDGGEGKEENRSGSSGQSHETTPSGSVKRKRGSQQYQATVEDAQE